MRRWGIWFGGLVLTLAGCSGDDLEAADLGAVCGATGPFRVLELAPDERLGSFPVTVGDRVLYLIDRLGPPDDGQTHPKVIDTIVWSTGPCGESPVQLATGMQSVFTRPMWPEVPLACEKETGSVVVLDPTGDQAPKVLFAAVPHTFHGCGLRWTPHGLLSVESAEDEDTDPEDQHGTLWLHPYPADPHDEPPPPVVLLDTIRTRASGLSGGGLIGNVVRSFDDFVLAVTTDDDLVRVDLPGGAVSVLQNYVYAFDTSESGEVLLWQDLRVTHADANYPQGAVFLADGSPSGPVFLADTALAFSLFPMGWADDGVVQLGLGYLNRDPKRVFFLPGLEWVDVSPWLFLNARTHDGRWIASDWDGNVEVRDLLAGEVTRLNREPSELMRVDDDTVDLLRVPPCCITGDFNDEGSLWRMHLDGTGHQLAARATRGLRYLDDGRLLTRVAIDADDRGDLILVDTDTRAERLVDDKVSTSLIDTTRLTAEGTILYSVRDGDRSGVYLAHLPASAAPRALRPAARARVLDLVPGPDGRPTPRPRTLDEPAPPRRGS